MRKLITLLLCSASVLFTQRALAQADLDQLLKGSVADANYLAQGYLEPVLNAVGSGLNQGWYNTAGNHKKLGFDLTISVSSIQFPSSDASYVIDNNKLKTLQHVDAAGNPIANGSVPTFIGSDVAPRYGYKLTPGVGDFDGPPGVNISDIPLGGLPIPIFNLGIGIPWNTDVKLRYGSFSGSGGTKVNLFGFAIQHDIKQHIPGLKELPFDLSALFGYTTFSTEVGFDSSAPDQLGVADFTATTIQGIIGKKFSVLTIYGGLGYNFSSGSFKAKGKYNPGTPEELIDPISISTSVSGPRVTAGLRLKLAVFTFHGDYTIQRYNTLTVGFGICVR